MPTTTLSHRIRFSLATLLLGLVMAAGIYLVAEPEFAWMGFVLAAMYSHGGGRSACAGRVGSGLRR